MSRAAPQRLIDYLTLAHEHLGAKGVDNARLDAELLLAHALGLSRVELYTNYDRPLSADEVDSFRQLLRRRAQREPLAYIVGRREFWSLELEVDRRVLIPRPETEVLVQAAMSMLRVNGAPRRVLDLGTGSGAIAIALAVELPALTLMATDVAAAALEVAPRNARKHGVAERIEFRQGDLFDAVRDGERFDLIVCNPPYCAYSELAGLEPEVREWEPGGALACGAEGTDVSRRIIERAADFLQPGGSLLLEVGTQADRVHDLFTGGGWRNPQTFRDLAGRARVIAAESPVR